MDKIVPKYRPDIDGLRAIAVTSVVIFHAVPSLIPSGFVGVDIFFVISGYLIGGVILTEAVDRKFSFANFYARRARRILPALTAVVAFTLIVGIFFFDAAELLDLAKQAIGSMLGVSNIYFWKGTDYFATDANLLPLLMTWSLGVEEQFYILFPFVMFALVRLKPRHQMAGMAFLIAGSLALSIWMVASYPISAFYLLPPRAWELGCGVILAMAHYHIPNSAFVRGKITEFCAICGIMLVIAANFAFDEKTAFPGLAALLPVIGTMLLLQAQGSWINRIILSCRAMVFVGLISYSWYLWHWPLMSLARNASDIAPSSQVMLMVAALSFVMGVFSWRYVERPFRKQHHGAGETLARYAVLLAVVLAVPLALRQTGGWPERTPEAVRLAEAVKLQGRGSCLVPYGVDRPDISPQCNPKNARIALLGDSHGSAIGTGLKQAAAGRGWDLVQMTKSACVPILGFAAIDSQRPSHASECNAFLDRSIASILQNPKIEIIVIAGAWPSTNPTAFRRFSGNREIGIVPAPRALHLGLTSLIKLLQANGKKVLVVGDVPRFDFDPMRHAISDAFPARHFLGNMIDGSRRYNVDTVPVERLLPQYEGSRKIVVEAAHSFPGTGYLDARTQLCPNQVCSLKVGDYPLFFDNHHLSVVGSRKIDWGALDLLAAK